MAAAVGAAFSSPFPLPSFSLLALDLLSFSSLALVAFLGSFFFSSSLAAFFLSLALAEEGASLASLAGGAGGFAAPPLLRADNRSSTS